MHEQLGNIELILLDAMGVIYVAGDDVGELLIPFLREKGAKVAESVIQGAYRQASLGMMTSRAFWIAMGIDPVLEDEYLARHRLQPDLMKFIHYVKPTLQLACLSNDVSEWSEKLRRRYSLETPIPRWIISGDVGYRKPDARIYDLAVSQLALRPEQILFVDDRLANVRAARAQGLCAVLFDTGASAQADEPAYGFGALIDTIRALRDHTR